MDSLCHSAALAARLMAILALTVSTASADPIAIYTSRSAWQGAVPGASVIDFDGTTATSTFYGSTPTVFEGVTFQAPELFVNTRELDYDAPHHQSGYLEWQNPPLLNVSFPGPVHAIGFDYGTFYGDIHNLALTLPWGDVLPLRTAAFTNRFFGLVSDRPFNSFVLTDVSGNFPTLDNFAHAEPVPEPGSLFLAGGGLLWCVRRIRRSVFV